jgi:hypothetical protein
VGIGVTPEATTASKLLQLGTTGTISWFDQGDDQLDMSINAVNNSGNKYITTNEASMYTQYAGTHSFKVAPSGTADSAISWTTAMTIENDGSIEIGSTQASLFLTNNEATGDIQLTRAEHSSFVGQVQNIRSVKSASSAFQFLAANSNNGGDDEFRLRGDGQAYADGSWNGGGADYAEYFEWSDGNTANEDRRGYSVVLDDNKIRPALAGETPIGVISGNPSVVGDSAWNKWDGKYLTDDFGTYILEEHTVTEWEAEEANEDGELSIVIKSFESDRIPAEETVPSDAVVSTTDDNGNVFKRRTLNPDWNPDTDYVSREDRKEWDTVGLMGKLRVLKGQPVDARWIKMRDVSDTVEEWLVR